MAVEQFLYLVRELDLKTLNLLVMLVAVGAGVSGATGKAHDVVNPIEVDAIKALMEQTTETFNRHDAKAWAVLRTLRPTGHRAWRIHEGC